MEKGKMQALLGRQNGLKEKLLGSLSLAVLGLGLVLTSADTAQAQAQMIETAAKQAYVLDLTTDRVLLSKNADQHMPTASMSKLMTALMVFDALDAGTVTLDTKFLVSEKAWRKTGSKMFVEVGKSIRVEDLLRGVLIQSGNDATIVLAEGLAGDEDLFAKQMTQRAKELGMTHSNFMNASGWPDPDHYSSAHDLAILAEYIIDTYPQYYKYFSEREFTWSGITQANRNPLLGRVEGADGLKTGHTEEAGYGLVGSALRNDRRIVMVLNGLESKAMRVSESKRLMNWAMNNFQTHQIFSAGDIIAQAPVWRGQNDTISLVLTDDIDLTLSASERRQLTATLEVKEPLPAPIESGTAVGFLRLDAPGLAPKRYPVYTGNAVDGLTASQMIMANAYHMMFGDDGQRQSDNILPLSDDVSAEPR